MFNSHIGVDPEIKLTVFVLPWGLNRRSDRSEPDQFVEL